MKEQKGREGRKEITTKITRLIKDNFIKFDDQQKILQVVREFALMFEPVIKAEMASQREKDIQELEGMKTRTYNKTKKHRCESCGVLEGSFCKDGCYAMEERYKNKGLDTAIDYLKGKGK